MIGIYCTLKSKHDFWPSTDLDHLPLWFDRQLVGGAWGEDHPLSQGVETQSACSSPTHLAHRVELAVLLEAKTPHIHPLFSICVHVDECQ